MSKSYRVTHRKVIFSKGPIHLVDVDVQMGSGKKLSRQILEHAGAVVIIPRLGKDRYLLIRQFRFAARDWLWEWPAGGIEKGETLRQAARRELMEEAGYCPRKLTKLIQFYPTPGVSGEIMYLFLAEQLERRTARGDADEEIEVGVFRLEEIRKMIQRGRIIDAKTILGYYLLREGRF